MPRQTEHKPSATQPNPIPLCLASNFSFSTGDVTPKTKTCLRLDLDLKSGQKEALNDG